MMFSANPSHSMTFSFDLLHTDGAARRGRLHTAHGAVETPALMAVGTQASVKGLTPAHRAAVRRTIVWAERCKAAHRRADQALFAIVQGGTDVELRRRCAEALTTIGFDGYALGGFSVGETTEQMVTALAPAAAALPADR